MKISIGTIVESEFGRGPVVAITKDWLIHEIFSNKEVCIHIPDGGIWIPIDFDTPEDNEMVICSFSYQCNNHICPHICPHTHEDKCNSNVCDDNSIFVRCVPVV